MNVEDAKAVPIHIPPILYVQIGDSSCGCAAGCAVLLLYTSVLNTMGVMKNN